MMDAFKQRIAKQMLRYHVSSAIFCQRCENILDVRRACSVDILIGDQVARSMCLCCACYDSSREDVEKIIAKNPGYSLDVTDGREVYGQVKVHA